MKTSRIVTMHLGFFSNIALTLLLLAGMNTGVYAGGIYKWVDEQGNVHYSQDPQTQSAQEMKIKIPKTSASDDNADAEQASDDDSQQKASEEERAKKQQAMNEAAAKKQQEAQEKNCNIAMKRLATISAGGRLYEVDEKGERHYWDDSTRQAKLAEAQGDVDKWCGQE